MLDAVIVTANSRDMVLRCLEHLPPGEDVRPVVVDNGSRDDTSAAVAAARPDAIVVRLDEPAGLAHAFNRGAAAADGEAILFLNDDILATAGAVARLRRTLADRPGTAAVAGRLVEPDTLQTQARYLPAPFPSAAALLGHATGLAALRRAPGPDSVLLANTTETVAVDQPAGACLLVPRSLHERLGGWDERFFFWYEDVDVCRRLSREGTLWWVPSAAFRHEGGASFAKRERVWNLRTMLHGVLTYAGIHLTPAQRRSLGAALTVTSLARIAVFTVLRRPAERTLYRDVLGAAIALLRGRPVPAIAA